jgi:hypothetical protein
MEDGLRISFGVCRFDIRENSKSRDTTQPTAKAPAFSFLSPFPFLLFLRALRSFAAINLKLN